MWVVPPEWVLSEIKTQDSRYLWEILVSTVDRAQMVYASSRPSTRCNNCAQAPNDPNQREHHLLVHL